MKIALAQIQPTKGDVKKNIEVHLEMISQAVGAQADAIFFPELSITSYEPELAEELSFGMDDARLTPFEKLSRDLKITVGIGIPQKTSKGVHITMLIFNPTQERTSYAKQMLHDDEKPYFIEGNHQSIIESIESKIAPAICYESLQAKHFERAQQLGATIYLASVAKPQRGIDKAYQYFPELAKKNSIPVLMVNSIGYCDNFLSAGQTAVWNSKGERVGQLNEHEEGILLYDTKTEKANIKYSAISSKD